MTQRLSFDDDNFMQVRLDRRSLFLGAGAGLLTFGILSRLAWLQVVQGRKYAMLAEDNRINVKILPPLRGMIVDRFGVPLADNTRNFRLVITPEQAKPLKATLARLQKMLALSDREVDAVLKAAKQAPSFVALEVRDYLTWDQLATVEVHSPDLPGVSIEEGWTRLYPFAEATAHLVGYVGAPTKDEAGDNPLLYVPGFRIGKSAMEKALEPGLRGIAGESQVEVNVLGREVRELARRDPEAGDRLTLSVDAELQQQLQARLSQERSASAVIMDVHTGEVYALASSPSFDPNQFSRQLTNALWQEVLGDETTPLTNKAVSGQYPPGSTFKMVTAMAALEAGIINEHTSFFCPGHYNLGSMKFHCWKPDGHGTVNVVAALEKSCDTFFYEVANRTGIIRIGDMARRLGLGERLGIELAEEQPGLVPTPEWKAKRVRERRKSDPTAIAKWLPGETIVAAIGQGYMLTTPLQLATMTARLVNGGKAVKPWLVHYSDQQEVHNGIYPDLGLKQEHLKLVMDGMWRVVNSPSGTAHRSRLRMDNITMGGKTGTAQVQRITAAQRAAGIKNDSLPWKQRHHALFVGYAPAEAPQYAIAVVVEHGVGGSLAAAPIARDLVTLTINRDPARMKAADDASAPKSENGGEQ